MRPQQRPLRGYKGDKMDEVLLYWQGTIEKDIAGFADPRTKVSVESEQRKLAAQWTVRGRPRSAVFQLSGDGDFRWLDRGTRRPYREFLVSEEMGDFTQLSASIARAFPVETTYVPTKARTEQAQHEQVSDTLVLSEVGASFERVSGRTKLFFLKGDAGAGKSTLLRQLTGEQARRYRKGDAPFLFVYVSAQGRALSNLRDAISGELDDLRAAFTRDAVPALVRNGLLVPIVDGFDELLGAAGYGDAFGSLQQFLSQLDGQGAMIVSARSAFYDVEFIGRSRPEGSDLAQYDVEPVTLAPWREEDVHLFLARARGAHATTQKDLQVLRALTPADRELLGKPFFTSLLPQYIDNRTNDLAPSSLLEYLVNAYVRRESGKIVDRDGNALLPVSTHRMFFAEVTEAMWSYENRDLGEEDLRVLAEIVAGAANLPSDTAKQFVAKITSYHGFQTAQNGSNQRRFRFEHEVYFDYFLAQVLRDQLRHPQKMAGFLDRGLIPDEVVRSTVDEGNAQSCLALTNLIPHDGVLQENRRRNLGALVASAFAHSSEIRDFNFSDLSFVNVDFGSVSIVQARFHNCFFSNVGLEHCRMKECEFSETHIDRLIVSKGTRLEVRGLTPGENVRCVHAIESARDFYAPSGIMDILRELGVQNLDDPPPRLSDTAQAVLDLWHRLVQKFRRTTLICLQDDNLISFYQNQHWPTLHKLLIESQVVHEETGRPTSGTRKTFIRPAIDLAELLHHQTTADEQLQDDSIGFFGGLCEPYKSRVSQPLGIGRGAKLMRRGRSGSR
jgi:hypothetical protein